MIYPPEQQSQSQASPTGQQSTSEGTTPLGPNTFGLGPFGGLAGLGNLGLGDNFAEMQQRMQEEVKWKIQIVKNLSKIIFY